MKEAQLLLAGTILALLSGSAFAQEDPGHPRINEVQGRIDNQEARINSGVSQGQMTQGQAAHDQARLNRVENQMHRDELKNGGHITKREQAQLNRELNHNSNKIYRQRHNQ